jgi:rRNA maturation protein Nop10
MEQEQVRCPDCNESYTRLLSRWKFCPFCGNRPTANVPPPYSVNEIVALLNLSRETVIRMFKHVPGVIVLSRPEEMHKRQYNSLRVPRHVYQQVMDGLTVKPGRQSNASRHRKRF